MYGRGVEVLVLGLGVERELKCPKRVRRAIRKAGVKRIVLAATPKACKKYNKAFRAGKRVAFLAHGTC